MDAILHFRGWTVGPDVIPSGFERHFAGRGRGDFGRFIETRRTLLNERLTAIDAAC